ncbi:MAG: hypothetical protein HY651_12890 [Acidobacteria bacterium]|nr:hypothetical protein [Acidobacteriota bacterium]
MIFLLLLLLGGMENGGVAQQRSLPPIAPSPRTTDNNNAPYNLPPSGPSRNLKMMKESFEQTKKDTAELYDLAAELKEEVEKADENTLSISVIKKAETVEKLAEKIKNRMKNL